MVLYTRVLRAVNVNWNDNGWNVNANSVDNPNDWNDGNRVFSRNYYFSSRLKVEKFLSLVLSSSHLAFFQFLEDVQRVLYIFHCLIILPRN